MNFKGFLEMLDRLDLVRTSMNKAKNTKLLRKWAKKGDYTQYPAQDIIDAVYEEIEEFAIALGAPLSGPTLIKLKDETRDLSNTLDMLWDVLGLGDA